MGVAKDPFMVNGSGSEPKSIIDAEVTPAF